MKKVLSVILALVMALSVVSVSAFAADDDYADFDGTITVGETRPVNLPGLTQYSKYVFIQFIPENDGWYAISSDSRENADSDPYLELYELEADAVELGNYVVKVDDADSDTTDFYLEYYFEAGKVYYFVMGNFRSATVWDITLECLHAEYKDGKCASCGVACDHKKVDNMFDSCPCGKTFDGKVVTLTEGKYTADVECEDGEYTFIKFVPEETGIFHAQSDTSKHEKNIPDPLCDVYDVQGNLVAYHDDISVSENAENYNFDLVYEFEAGEVYFIGLWDYQAGKEWSFTFEDISTHSFEVPVEDDETTTPDDETTVVTEGDTNTDTNEGGTTTPEETPKTETVVHKLTFVPQKDATCLEAGYTGYAYCEECEECTEELGCGECEKFEAIGYYEIPQTDHFFDEDGNCMTEGCDYVDPVLSCTHMCHSTGIMGTIWSVVRFFSWLFGIQGNRECACGVLHW